MNGPCAPAAALPGAPTHATPSVIRACRPRQAAEQIIAYAAAHGIPPMAQVIEDSPEEHALRDLGWIATRVANSRARLPFGRFPARPSCSAEDAGHRETGAGLGRGLSAQPAELGRSDDRPDDLGRQPAPGLCRRCR